MIQSPRPGGSSYSGGVTRAGSEDAGWPTRPTPGYRVNVVLRPHGSNVSKLIAYAGVPVTARPSPADGGMAMGRRGRRPVGRSAGAGTVPSRPGGTVARLRGSGSSSSAPSGASARASEASGRIRRRRSGLPRAQDAPVIGWGVWIARSMRAALARGPLRSARRSRGPSARPRRPWRTRKARGWRRCQSTTILSNWWSPADPGDGRRAAESSSPRSGPWTPRTRRSGRRSPPD